MIIYLSSKQARKLLGTGQSKQISFMTKRRPNPTVRKSNPGSQEMRFTTLLRGPGLAAAICVALCAAPAAQATNTLVTSGWANGHESFAVSNHSGTVYAGGFTGTWNGTPIVFWCEELGQNFGLGGTYTEYTAGPLVNLRLSELFQADLNSALTGPVNVNSAAFQLAIWNIIYDNDNFVNSGSWFASGDPNAINLANSWLAGLPTSSSLSLMQLTSDTHQDFVTPGTPLNCCSQVPEPSSLPLLGAGLAAVLFAMRNRRINRRFA
jgi:hypothetical protein